MQIQPSPSVAWVIIYSFSETCITTAPHRSNPPALPNQQMSRSLRPFSLCQAQQSDNNSNYTKEKRQAKREAESQRQRQRQREWVGNYMPKMIGLLTGWPSISPFVSGQTRLARRFETAFVAGVAGPVHWTLNHIRVCPRDLDVFTLRDIHNTTTRCDTRFWPALVIME